VAWLGGLSIGLAVASMTVLLWPERGPALVRPEGAGEEGTSRALFVIIELIAFPMMLVVGLGAVISLFVRFHRARGDERQQIKWFAYAAALTLVWTFVVDGIPDRNRLFETVTALLGLLVIPLLPVATGVAIFKYRLYDVDRIVNRTLVYVALTASLVLVYLGGVISLQYTFRILTGGSSQLAVVVSTLTIAALFNPLRRRIQGFIDRRFFRRKYDAAKVLEGFSVTLREETDLDRLTPELLGVVRETMQPAHTSLWLRPQRGRASEVERR
jgi:hypothetical protein